jgi:hypothetical protein
VEWVDLVLALVALGAAVAAHVKVGRLERRLDRRRRR